MNFLKTFLKVLIPYTATMVIANYIFIKGSFESIIIISLIISTLNAIEIYMKEQRTDIIHYK